MLHPLFPGLLVIWGIGAFVAFVNACAWFGEDDTDEHRVGWGILVCIVLACVFLSWQLALGNIH